MRVGFFTRKCNPRPGLSVSRCRAVIKQSVTGPEVQRSPQAPAQLRLPAAPKVPVPLRLVTPARRRPLPTSMPSTIRARTKG
jgi:hypothetical protein